MLKLRDDAPLDLVSIAILKAVVSAAREAGTNLMLVGATARDIVMSHVYGIPLQRATADLDFAVAIPGWDAFGQVIEQLVADKRFARSAGVAHRLLFNGTTAIHPVPVDLVPFGPGVGGQIFAWPDDPDIQMNVAGYDDAARATELVDIAGMHVPVLSAAGLALLKVFAWIDRHATTRKDASDILTLAINHSELGNAERMYDDETLLAEVDYDYLRGSARLLSRDVRNICSDITLEQIRSALSPTNLTQMARDAFREGTASTLTIDGIARLFDDFSYAIVRR